MFYLVAVSLLWAFSFGLIKNQLAGLDSYWVATIRLGLAGLVFLPFLKPRAVSAALALRLGLIGAVQFGLMYVLYIAAFQHLQAHEVAMFTVFTPIYVVLLDGLRARRFNGQALVAAALAGGGAAILKWQGGISSAALTGFLLLQGANLCFAAGQLAYRHERKRQPDGSHASVFGWLYLGAFLAAGTLALILGDWDGFKPSPSQWGVLAYLGILATGLGFFGWNWGATKVSAPTLAVSNNLLVPLAVIVALMVFGESAPWPSLSISIGLMGGALWLAARAAKSGSGNGE
jgi:drug/metabolite transporter (DMT)-like permease